MDRKEYDTKGVHVICDMYGVKYDLLENINYLEQLGRFAIAVAGATYVDVVKKKFQPQGTTLLFLLEESHLSFHCYSEKSFLALDIFTCGNANPEKALDYIIKQLQPERVYRKTIIRGVEPN